MRKFLALVGLVLISLIGCQSNQSNAEQIVSSNIPVSETPFPRQTEKIDPSWAYINRDIQWKAPPKQTELTKEGSLNSTVVVFYPSGKFAFVGCTLYRDNKTKAITLSAGDDYSVRKGTWKQNEDGSITTISRLTHGMKRSSTEAEETKRWIIRKKSIDKIASELEFSGQIYIPIPKLGGFDQLSPMIADDNQ